MLAENKESGKPPNSKSTLEKSDFVTREPILIFSRIKNASDKEEKKKLNQVLETLRKKLPEGFKIGAAIGKGDCFFDSIAQGLKELKDKGLITASKGFTVKSLRENCKQYAAQEVNQSKKGSWLRSALKGEGEKLCEYIPRIEFTAEDIENAIWGRPEVEGKMICEKYGVKVRTIELRDKEIDGLHVTKGKVGTGNNIIYIVNYRNHFVPLLSNIEKDIKRSIKVSREEAYISTSRKRRRSVTDKDDIVVLKRSRVDVHNINEEIRFAISVAGKEGTPRFNQFLDFLIAGEGKECLEVLKGNGINLSSMSSILSGSGSDATKAFKGLYDLWFDEEGNKTQYLKTLKKAGITLPNMSSILSGAGANTPKAFKDLYELWFDDVQGNKKQYLKHFTEKKDKERSFTVSNLSGILSGAGAKAGSAFKELHDVCFNDNGEETELLNNFYDVGFKPGNLSSMLCGSGSHASHRLKKFHNTLLFDDKGKETELLSDFSKIGFNPQSLCSILSASVSSLGQFHDFCSTDKAKAYLIHFSQAGFTINKLSEILHGARASICSALKDFHKVCFDAQGNNTQLLNDFYSVGFTATHLSSILGMAGNNSASIFKNFHKSCFNERNYLNHFFAEEKLFTPTTLSRVLHRVGLSICSAFEKLHGFCFDKAGSKTDYLNNLIKNNSPDTILNTLYNKVEKVKKAPTNPDLHLSSASGRTEQEQNLGDSKIKRKTRKGITNQSGK